MKRLGVVNLGLDPDKSYLDNFLSALSETMNPEGWVKEIAVFDYKELDPTKVAKSSDALVLSPGSALVGLPTATRAKRDPDILNVYILAHSAAQDGIPLLGVNAGHVALNLAYGNAIDKVPGGKVESYQKEQELDLSKCDDPLFEGIESITMQLSNHWLVLPKDKQAKRWGQETVNPLREYGGGVLISRVNSEAPVYGVQFNIQPGTEAIFKNFFRLAHDYLTK